MVQSMCIILKSGGSTTCYLLLATYHLLVATYHLSLTTYYLPRTTYYLLLTAHCTYHILLTIRQAEFEEELQLRRHTFDK